MSSACTSASSALTSTAESLRFIEWDWVGAATEGDRGMGVGVSMGSKAAGGGVGSRGAIPARWRTSRMDTNSKNNFLFGLISLTQRSITKCELGQHLLRIVFIRVPRLGFGLFPSFLHEMLHLSFFTKTSLSCTIEQDGKRGRNSPNLVQNFAFR